MRVGVQKYSGIILCLFLLINGNPLLMFFIVTLFITSFLSLYARMRAGQRMWMPPVTGCCPQRSRSLWSQRAWLSLPMTRRNCCCSTRTPSSAELTKRYSFAWMCCTVSAGSRLPWWCGQLNSLLSESQRNVGVVWKLLSSCEESSLKLHFFFTKLFSMILICCSSTKMESIKSELPSQPMWTAKCRAKSLTSMT